MRTYIKMKNRFIPIILLLCFTVLILLYTNGVSIQDSLMNQEIIYAIIAESRQDTNQKCSFVRINLKTSNIIDTIFNFGEDGSYPEAALSLSGKYVAFNKWIKKQDRELFLYDLENNISTQLTFESNGEINRISWLNDSTIIGVFCSHERGAHGWRLFSFDIKTKKMKFLQNANSIENETVYFNGVKALAGENKILFARGTEHEYIRSWNDKKYKNTLYICDSRGETIKPLLTFDDRTIGGISVSPDNEYVLLEAFRYPQNNNDLEASDLYLYHLDTETEILLENGTENTQIEHWNLNWLDDTTVIYRNQSGWNCLNLTTMKKSSLFLKCENLDKNVVALIPKVKGEN